MKICVPSLLYLVMYYVITPIDEAKLFTNRKINFFLLCMFKDLVNLEDKCQETLSFSNQNFFNCKCIQLES